MYVKAEDNWLAALGHSNDITNVITDLNGLSWQQAQENLDKTYGEGAFSCHDHGTVIVTYSRKAKEVYLQKRRDSGKSAYINGVLKEHGEY